MYRCTQILLLRVVQPIEFEIPELLQLDIKSSTVHTETFIFNNFLRSLNPAKL